MVMSVQRVKWVIDTQVGVVMAAMQKLFRFVAVRRELRMKIKWLFIYTFQLHPVGPQHYRPLLVIWVPNNPVWKSHS